MSSEAGSATPSPFRYHSLATRTYSLVGLRQRRRRVDDDRAVHAVRDVREHRLRAAVVHEDAGVARLEAERERLAGRDVAERDVRRDARGVEVDRVRDRAAVRQRHLDRLALRGRGRSGPARRGRRTPRCCTSRPGAISTTMSFSVMCTFTRSPAGDRAAASRRTATCAFASSSAFSPVLPAKLWSGRLVAPSSAARGVIMRRRRRGAPALTSSRASSAACISDDRGDREHADRDAEQQRPTILTRAPAFFSPPVPGKTTRKLVRTSTRALLERLDGTRTVGVAPHGGTGATTQRSCGFPARAGRSSAQPCQRVRCRPHEASPPFF